VRSAGGAARQRRRGALRPLLAAGAALLAAGCASTAGRGLTADELARFAAERHLPASRVELPFALDDGMRAWLRTEQEAGRIDRAGPPARRLDALLRALAHEEGLGITYRSGRTTNAAETFRSRTANCLSFTQLFVGFAREMGLDAYFLAVDDLESYERVGDLVLLSGHVTAGFGPPHELRILEFNLGPEVDYDRVRPVSDLTAVAMFYSNRGAELLADGAPAAALEALAIATALAPDLPGGWVNLGVARRRSGDAAGAEAAYRRALEADPRAASAYQNLAALLQLRGETAEAEELLRLGAGAGSRNPFAYLELGDLSLRHGRPDEARRFYRKALRLYRDRPEPYAALGQAALADGDPAGAHRWLARARRRGPDDARVRLLAARLAAGGGGSAPAARGGA
jgi:Flp pilus assembly protein TadD